MAGTVALVALGGEAGTRARSGTQLDARALPAVAGTRERTAPADARRPLSRGRLRRGRGLALLPAVLGDDAQVRGRLRGPDRHLAALLERHRLRHPHGAGQGRLAPRAALPVLRRDLRGVPRQHRARLPRGAARHRAGRLLRHRGRHAPAQAQALPAADAHRHAAGGHRLGVPRGHRLEQGHGRREARGLVHPASARGLLLPEHHDRVHPRLPQARAGATGHGAGAGDRRALHARHRQQRLAHRARAAEGHRPSLPLPAGAGAPPRAALLRPGRRGAGPLPRQRADRRGRPARGQALRGLRHRGALSRPRRAHSYVYPPPRKFNLVPYVKKIPVP